MKVIIKKCLSVILSIALICTVMPEMKVRKVEAKTFTYDVDKAINFAKEHCNSDKKSHPNTKKGIGACNDKWLCAEFVYNCLKKGGLTVSKKKTNGTKYNVAIAKELGIILQDYGEKDSASKWTSLKDSYFKNNLKKGDVVIAVSKNTTIASGHAVIYSGKKDKNGNLLFYAHNSRKMEQSYAPSQAPYSIKEVYAIHLSNSQSYALTLNSPTTTNTTATISASLNKSAKVTSWGYDLGTSSRDEVKTCGTSVTQKSFKATISKYKGKDLKPGTTYSYRIWVKISGKTYKADGKFTTRKDAPAKPTLNMSSAYSNIGLGDTVTVTWNKVANANNYKIKVYDSSNAQIYSKEKITGTSCTIPATCTSKTGTYTINLYASNSYTDTKAGNSKSFTIHKNVNITFYDTISKKNISVQNKPYGHAAVAPKNPTQTGYTFIKWDRDFSKVTADITVNTVYEANEYSVTFVDGLTGKQIGKVQKVRYGNSATEPSTGELIHDGYTFVGWDVDFSKIETNTIVTSNYKWYNENYQVYSKIDSVLRNQNKDGYDITVTVQNGKNEIVQGRLVVALQSKDGLMYTTAESSAFSLSEKDSLDEKKTIKVFVPFKDLGYKVSVYTINNYENVSTLAQPLTQEIDNSSAWSAWKEYTGTIPVEKGVNGVSEVETKSDTPQIKQYRYRTKSTTTSYSTSMSGWTQSGGSWVSQGQSTLNYGVSWPSGFDTGNSLYKKYHNTKKSASETNTTKVTINSDTVKSYIYWHWCRGASVGAINRAIEWKKSSTYKKFHAFESSTKKSYTDSANAYKWKKTDVCNDTYWWNGLKSKTNGLVTIKTQKYTTYKKLFNYYKWSDWSAWSETPVTASADKEVATQTVSGKTTTYYRYKTNGKVEEPILENNKQLVDISGKVSSQFAGKEATVYVHKYGQTSDYTTEFIGKTTVGSNGEISIPNAKLREATSIETGNFKILASIEGNTEAIEIGTIEAPKPVYTVTYMDYNGNILQEIKNVTEGDTVTAPTYSEKEMGIPEGYEFTTWSESTVNVTGDIVVRPLIKIKKFVVVYVDWAKQDVQLEEMEYGEEINPPTPQEKEGYVTSWDMSDAEKIEETADDGSSSEKYIVTKNTVITTQYEERTYDVSFVEENVNEPCVDYYEENQGESQDEAKNNFVDSDIVTDTVTDGDRVDLPDNGLEESPDYLFYGWRNLETGEYLEDTQVDESGVYYPVYEFANSAEMPIASVETGEYQTKQTIELTCETTDAVIYYTTDGTNPENSLTAREYTEPIVLEKSATLSFCAMAMGMNNSSVGTELYAINTDTSGAEYCLVSVNANLPELEGNYYQALVKSGTKFNMSGLENITGYTYDGIFYDETFENELDTDTEVITESLNLYAKYTPKQYTAIFNDSDGKEIERQTVDFGEPAKEPEIVKKDGEVFVGWDSDEYLCMMKDGTFTAQYVPENEYATVALNKSTVTIMEGTEYSKLTATISPEELSNTEIDWDSENPDIATVDVNGVVEGKAAGTTVITATVVSTGENAECTVKVVGNYQTSIVLNEKSGLGIDSEGYLREVKPEHNTVANILAEFNNDLENLKVYDSTGQELRDDELVGTGTVIKLMSGDEVLDTMTIVMTGDVDGDGHLGNVDVSKISNWLIQKEELSYESQLASDVNGDGNVDNKDASMVSRYLVGKEQI